MTTPFPRFAPSSEGSSATGVSNSSSSSIGTQTIPTASSPAATGNSIISTTTKQPTHVSSSPASSSNLTFMSPPRQQEMQRNHTPAFTAPGEPLTTPSPAAGHRQQQMDDRSREGSEIMWMSQSVSSDTFLVEKDGQTLTHRGSFSPGTLLSPKSTGSFGNGGGSSGVLKKGGVENSLSRLSSTTSQNGPLGWKSVDFDDSLITYAPPPAASLTTTASRGGAASSTAGSSAKGKSDTNSVLMGPNGSPNHSKNLRTVPKTSNARKRDESYFVEICLLTFLLTLFSLLLITILLVFVVPPSPAALEKERLLRGVSQHQQASETGGNPTSPSSSLVVSASTTKEVYWHQLLSDYYRYILFLLGMGILLVIGLGYRIRESRRLRRQHLSDYISKTSKLLSTADMVETASTPASATSSRRTGRENSSAAAGVRSRRNPQGCGSVATTTTNSGSGGLATTSSSGSMIRMSGPQQQQQCTTIRVLDGSGSCNASSKY